jgi:hypothetical protein
MTLDQVILLEKHKDILKDNSQVIFAEGVTNASKSFILGIKFIMNILATPDNQKQFVLGGKSLPVLEKMFIQNEDSFYNIFRPICEYKSSGQGGAKIVITTPKGKKIIYLLGYDNRKRWSDILGLTIYGFNIEEINIADNDFVSEIFVRVFRNGGFLLASCNGGDPDTPVYLDYMNKGRPLEKYADEVPKETWLELERSEANSKFRYYFFTFEDNPIMTEQQKQALIENTPKDSYQWMTKILGIRGIREGVIYADYMTRHKNIIAFADVFGKTPKYNVEIMTIGIDVGGTDHTVFTLNVFTQGYRHHIVMDYMKLNNANHDKIWSEFVKWFHPYYEIYSMHFKGAFIDSAAKIMRLTLDSRLKMHYGLRCYNAKKYLIKERVDWGITQLDQGRLLFSEKAEDVYIAFTKAYYTNKSKTDIRAFNNHTHKDIVDSMEYGQAPYTTYMMKNTKK